MHTFKLSSKKRLSSGGDILDVELEEVLALMTPDALALTWWVIAPVDILGRDPAVFDLVDTIRESTRANGFYGPVNFEDLVTLGRGVVQVSDGTFIAAPAPFTVNSYIAVRDYSDRIRVAIEFFDSTYCQVSVKSDSLAAKVQRHYLPEQLT